MSFGAFNKIGLGKLILLTVFLISKPAHSQLNKFGITFLEKDREYNIECSFCDVPKSLVMTQYSEILSNSPIDVYSVLTPKNKELLFNYLDSQINQSPFRIRALLLMFKAQSIYNFILYKYDSQIDKINWGNNENRDLLLEALSYYQKILEEAESEEDVKSVNHLRMKLLDYLGVFYIDDSDQFFTDLGIDYILLEYDEHIDFSEYKCVYEGVNLGVNYSLGAIGMYGGEITYDFTEDINPFRNSMRVSLIGLRYQMNPTFNRSELLFDILSAKKVNFISYKLLQFGVQSGISNKNIWCWRPEIGVAYGPLSINYSYNLNFKKVNVPNLNTHMISINLSYPFIRTSYYN